jgi:hypothetical protein
MTMGLKRSFLGAPKKEKNLPNQKYFPSPCPRFSFLKLRNLPQNFSYYPLLDNKD